MGSKLARRITSEKVDVRLSLRGQCFAGERNTRAGPLCSFVGIIRPVASLVRRAPPLRMQRFYGGKK